MKQKRYVHPVTYYYLPQPSYWPLIGACGLFLLLIGIINIIHDNWFGHYFLALGAILLIYMLYGWFSDVINEGLKGLHSEQVERTYRWGMVWFIATEVAFFGTFFATLFYTRIFVIPFLGAGETHTLLWPKFKASWPVFHNPNPTLFPGPTEVIAAWGIPAFNTFLLLSSALAITWALWALTKNHRKLMTIGLFLTILLGFSFLGSMNI